MRVRNLHPWKVTPRRARTIQEELRDRLRFDSPHRFPRLAAGCDISYNKFDANLFAAVVVVNLETLETVEQASIKARATFPYIPGLLSFREIPPLLRIFRKLKTRPNVIVCDGQGFAHPRRFGLACHLGLVLDVPSLGCAKTRLIGEFNEPGLERGCFSPLCGQGDVLGSVLRTRAGKKPVFVSAGHRISLEMAREVVLVLTPRYRLPETTRRAHQLVNALRRSDSQHPPRPEVSS